MKTFIETLQQIHSNERHKTYGDRIRWIEISGSRRNAKRNYEKGWFSLWSPETVRHAFQFGHGSILDLQVCADINKQYTTFVDLETGTIL